MVLLQIAAIYGLVSGLVHPSCTSNTQCTRPGFFCYIEPDEDRGKVHPDAPGSREISHPDAVLCVQCQMCGEMPPLVPYRSPTESLTEEEVKDDRTNNWKDSPLGLYKEYNLVWDLHYPQQAGGGRAKTPDWCVCPPSSGCDIGLQASGPADRWRSQVCRLELLDGGVHVRLRGARP